VEAMRPVFAVFNARLFRLHGHIFTSLGELRGSYVILFVLLGIVFLSIEGAALFTGIVLTRRITTAVADLYRATQYVQSADFSHRVQVERRDQLGELGESFNKMTSSISELIEEENKRRRLENEISIAREVQNQLFPQKLPSVPGVEIDAICKAARSVSGDYYDFIRISPTRLGIALADISGKGISAALLMANVQAALRSDVLRYRDGHSGVSPEPIDTAEIVSHLNLHLFRNTSNERYATFFFGVYDALTRQLHYTNAGHLPPIYICGNSVRRLETGGMVVGLFNDVPFEQGAVEIEHGGILVAYSDGLIEPENVYGEEFGTERLIEVATRNRGQSPHVIADAMMRAAEEWSGSPEQADDMTVIVMRFSRLPQENRA
jgi:sigma-B regulation protein RsbU (phosphoserine phosphatase)